MSIIHQDSFISNWVKNKFLTCNLWNIYIEFLNEIVKTKKRDCKEKFTFLKIELLKIIEIIFGNHKSIVNYFSVFHKIYRIS